MNIKIISIGKLKEKYLKDGIAEYAKRLSRYCKIEFIELPDEKAPENLSISDCNSLKIREGELILKKIKDRDFVITLEINGKNLDSVQFSNYIEQLGVSGQSDITFVIGGSLGLGENVVEKSNYKLSFSKMTFPHQLMKLFLVEQVYRAFRIIKNEPYHK